MDETYETDSFRPSDGSLQVLVMGDRAWTRESDQSQWVPVPDDVAPPPRFPQAYVAIAPYIAKDAWVHLMMQVVAELRRVGASPDEVADYRREALSGHPITATTRWVSTG